MASIPQEQYVGIQYAGQEIDPLASKLSVLERRFDAHIGKGGNVHASVSDSEAGFMTPQDKIKLDNIRTGATQNSSDDFLLNRGNHTGVQPIESVSGLREELDDALAGGSNYRGLYPSLTALQEAIPVAAPGNYADVDEGEGIDAVRYIWDDSDQSWVSAGAGESLTAPQVKALYESNPNTNPLTDERLSLLQNNAEAIELLPSVSFANFGCVGDGSDETAGVRATLEYAAQNGVKISDFSGKTYKYSQNIVITAPLKKITLEGNVTLEGANAGITFQGSLAQLATLTQNAVAGASAISVSDASQINPGDLLIIENRTDFSFSLHRNYYYDGQYCRVASKSSNTLQLEGNLISSYPASSAGRVFKMSPIKVNVDGMSFTGGSLYSLTIRFAEGCAILPALVSNTEPSSAASAALNIDKCFSVSVSGGRYKRIYNPATGLDYGIVISNSEQIFVSNVDAFGGRHSVTTGGDAAPGAVPCRYIYVEDSVLSNDPASNIYNADFHGNTADSHYKNCVIYGRIGLAGENPAVIDCDVHSWPNTVYSPISYHELVGGDMRVIDCRASVGQGSTAEFLIDNLSSTLTEKISKPYRVVVENLEAVTNSAITGIINAFENSGQANQWILDGWGLKGANSLSRIMRYVLSGAGQDANFIQITNPQQSVPLALPLIQLVSTALPNSRFKFFERSGSNANGKYYQYANGSMICSNRLSIANTAISTAFLGGFRSGGISWDFPVKFSGNPETCLTPTGASAFSAVESSIAPEGLIFFLATPTSQTAATRSASVSATGRWGFV